MTNIEQKSVACELKFLGASENTHIVEGLAAAFGNVDAYGDVILPGAFAASLAENDNFPLLWNHDRREVIGRIVAAHETEDGLFIRAELPKDDTFVSGRVIPQLKNGSICKMSIGYLSRKDRITEGVRQLLDIDLKEVSLVVIPANPDAVVTSVKGELAADDIRPVTSIKGAVQSGRLTRLSVPLWRSLTKAQAEDALRMGLPMSKQLANSVAYAVKGPSPRDFGPSAHNTGHGAPLAGSAVTTDPTDQLLKQLSNLQTSIEELKQ